MMSQLCMDTQAAYIHMRVCGHYIDKHAMVSYLAAWLANEVKASYNPIQWSAQNFASGGKFSVLTTIMRGKNQI